jgi:glucose-6-phosphate 1-dehydrogenase
MDFDYRRAFRVKNHRPYERLLIDCLRGDLTLFVRQDGVDTQWTVVDPINQHWENSLPTEFPNYPAGSWGPEESDLLLKQENREWLRI